MCGCEAGPVSPWDAARAGVRWLVVDVSGLVVGCRGVLVGIGDRRSECVLCLDDGDGSGVQAGTVRLPGADPPSWPVRVRSLRRGALGPP